MRMNFLAFAAFGVAIASCGRPQEEPAAVQQWNPPPAGGSFEPLAVGNTWSYVGDDGASPSSSGSDGGGGFVPTSRTVSVTSVSVQNGIPIYVVEQHLSDGTVRQNWEEDLGDIVFRIRSVRRSGGTVISDQTFTPGRTRIDMRPDHLIEGATWTESFVVTPGGIQHEVTWTVEALDDPYTVPAGTISSIRLHRVDSIVPSSGVPYVDSDRLYWFAQRVGKVAEVEAGKENWESLSSFDVDTRGVGIPL